MNSKIRASVFVGICAIVVRPLVTQEPDQKTGAAQSSVADQPSESAPDHEWQQWLNDSRTREDRLLRLGIESRIARALADELNQPTAYARWRSLRAHSVTRSASLFFRCSEPLGVAYLFLLERKNESWHVTDHEEFDCHYDDLVSADLVWVRDPRREEIWVHHLGAGHGTGYVQQDFAIFMPVQGKLTNELETEEVVHSYPTAVNVRRDLDQVSTFAAIPVANSRERAIEETRSGTLNGHLSVQRRLFRWNSLKGRYLPSAFKPVVADAGK
jgi:hypothetical protein